MGNGDADWCATPGVLQTRIYYYGKDGRFLPMENGEAQSPAAAAGQPQLLLCFGKGGDGQWAMEKYLPYLLPGMRILVHIYLPIGGR